MALPSPEVGYYIWIKACLLAKTLKNRAANCNIDKPPDRWAATSWNFGAIGAGHFACAI
jgi:hypothetical protein